MLILVVFVLLLLVAVFAVSYFSPLNRTPLFLTVPLVVSVYIPLSIIALVPADIAETGLGLSENLRLILWRIIYWLSFCLTWVILPSLQYYVQSGYHDPILKVKDALKSNVRQQLIVIGVGILGLVYMGASSGLSPKNLEGLAIALSHSYALILAIWLLGHGLVSVPRRLWQANTGYLSELYGKAQMVCDQYADALGNYHDVAQRIMGLIPIKTFAYENWIDELVEQVRSSSLGYPQASSRQLNTSDLNDAFLANLSARLSREQARAIRARADWVELLKTASFYLDIQGATGRDIQFAHYHTFLNPRQAKIWYADVRPWITKLLAALLLALSLSITESELFMGTRFSVVDWIIEGVTEFLKVPVTMLLLGYMCFVAGSALTQVRVFNLYGLVPRDSDPSSAVFYAMYACRLAVPLSYNFLMMSSNHNDSVFQNYLGKFINLTPLGKYFNDILPRCIILFMALSFFNFYTKLQSYLGFLGDDYTENSGDGRDLVKRSLTDERYQYSLARVEESE